ncbi:MAG: hypothetical protein V7764_02535 [Pseudomonas marincola]|jgi:hypothetical protein|uniref:hypothetical protein n=1 Tax=Pseudomonas TaxID=286 RepID=UPI00257A7D68|nr:hypothetical protein [Pseudomonas sp.]
MSRQIPSPSSCIKYLLSSAALLLVMIGEGSLINTAQPVHKATANAAALAVQAAKPQAQGLFAQRGAVANTFTGQSPRRAPGQNI